MRQRKNKTYPDSSLENVLLNQGYEAIIGIDEVGRGCWAGPVYLGAYIFTRQTVLFDGVNDSKLIIPDKRKILHSKFLENPGSFHIEIGSIENINKLGIGKMITNLIENVLEKFQHIKAYYLIDGYFAKDFGKNTKQIIKGDTKHYSISAASIVAKVERDGYMVKLAENYPYWKLDSNKGYGTKDHIDAITKYGISDIHRIKYKPIAKFIEHQGKGQN